MPLYLTNDEEWALHKFLTLTLNPDSGRRLIGSILNELLEADRRQLWRLQATLERRLGEAEYLKPRKEYQ